MVITGLVVILLFFAGGALLSNLGAERVPNSLKPLENRWIKLGHTPRSFRFLLWGLFAAIAFAMLMCIVFPLISAAIDLG